MLKLILLCGVFVASASSECNVGIPGCSCPVSYRMVQCNGIGFTRIPQIQGALDSLTLWFNQIEAVRDEDVDDLTIDVLDLRVQATGRGCVRNDLTKPPRMVIYGLCPEVRR